MEQRRSASIVPAVVLILLGVGIFLFQMMPTPQGGSWMELNWPLVVPGIGVVLLVLARVRHVPSLAIPAAVMACLGTLLYWQNYTWNWESWAYVWTLLPCFLGFGFILEALLGADIRLVARGEALIVLGLGLFAFFTTFYSTIGFVGPSWPLLSILFGSLLLVRSIVLLRSTSHRQGMLLGRR